MIKRIIVFCFLFLSLICSLCISICAETEVPVWSPLSSSSKNSIPDGSNSAVENNAIADQAESSSNSYSSEAILADENIVNENTIRQASSNLMIANETSSQSNIVSTNAEAHNSVSGLHSIPNTVSSNTLNLTCGGAILVEQNSGSILYDHNMHEKLRPASVTKIMSILLIMEALDSGQISLSDKVPCTEDAAQMGGSQIWLDSTEELTVDEMLKAICVVSANDCTVAMADYLAGSQESFVEKMNSRAKDLGMDDTTFKNCHGIDEDGHVTSAYDIAIMSRELLVNHPQITNYTTIYMDSLRGGKSQLVNTNKLVRNYEGCTGLKTGSTSVALFNLSASATRNDLSLIAVVMRAETTKVRFNEASKLLNYGFGNYQYIQMASKGDVVGECVINKGIKNVASAVYETDFGLVTSKNDKNNIQQDIQIYNNVFAPVNIGQKIGAVTFKTPDGQEIGSVGLVCTEYIDKYSFLSMLLNTYKNWFTLFRCS